MLPRNAAGLGADVVLEPLTSDTFRAALEAAEYKQDEISRLAKESGRSLTVLRRRLSTLPAVQSPPWAKDASTSKVLIPLYLAGSWNSTISIQDDTALTTSKDVLEALARGQGPEKFLVTLGYAGWTAGQLEQELARNTWLTVKPENSQQQDKVIFDLPNEEKLTAAMRLLGIDFATFSETAGHA